MTNNKIYLMPQILRRGATTIVWVERSRRSGYEIGIASDLHDCIPPPCSGCPKDYGIVGRTVISKDFYDAFVQESRLNHTRYAVNKRKERNENEI
jgi:hypothetical protein